MINGEYINANGELSKNILSNTIIYLLVHTQIVQRRSFYNSFLKTAEI